MKYFRKLVGDRIYLSPRNSEDVEKFTEWLNVIKNVDLRNMEGEESAILQMENTMIQQKWTF